MDNRETVSTGDRPEKYRIGKVYISRTTPQKTIAAITQAIKEGRNEYICVSNVRTTAHANKKKESEYRDLMNNAFMCTPDGMPLVWMARLWGLGDVQRTVGPDIFTAMLNDKDSGIKHFLLGDTEETLAKMEEKHPEALIAGKYSPPFCDLDNYDYAAIAHKINTSGANIVWLSLRAPKQDFFAARLLPHLDKKICIGVGAAFRFSLGQIKHPPKIIKKLGLTGLFWRKNKFRLIKWYIQHFYSICCWSTNILYSRLCGKKYNQ